MRLLKSPRQVAISTLLLMMSLVPALLTGHLIVPIFGGEPAGDSRMIIECVGLLPATSSCVDENLQPFETIVYDRNANGIYDSLEPIIVGLSPNVGVPLVDDANIKYRDTISDNSWAFDETVFYDVDGTVANRMTLIGTPTTSISLVKDDPSIRFADANGNGKLDGVVKVAVRLDNLGGTLADGTREDVDAIQAVYTYDRFVLRPMRVNYIPRTGGAILPDQDRFTSAVRRHCSANGSALDTISADEILGKISSSHLCLGSGSEVGLGCDPATSALCPGDGAGSPLQNLDAVNVQFMVLSRGTVTLTHVIEALGSPGSKVVDIDETSTSPVPLELVDGIFDNRKPDGNRPPTARFSFPPKGTTGQPVFFDGSNSTDPDGVIVSFVWNFGDGSPNATGPLVSHVYGYPNAGGFGVSLLVVDNGNATDVEIHLVPVNQASGNAPPAAIFVASPPKATVGEPITFNGNSSFDLDGMIVSYYWTFGDGGNATGSVVTHAYQSVGTYTVTLTVTDDGGAMGVDYQTIVVNPTVSHQPGISVGDYARYSFSGNLTGIPNPVGASFNVTQVVGTNVTLFTTVFFSNGTSTSMEQTVDTRSFTSSGLLLTGANLTVGDQIWADAPYRVNSTAVGFFAGADRLTNVLSTSQFGGGFTAQWDQISGVLVYYNASFPGPNGTVSIRILIVETNIWGPGPSPNQLPTARFTFTPSKGTVGEGVTFDASSSFDPDGVIVTYSWDFGTGTNSSSGAVVVVGYTAPGTYTVTLTVRDDDGATDTEVNIVIVNPAIQNQLPVASFFFEPQNPILGEFVRFDGSGSFDSDGTITSYRWRLGDGTEILAFDSPFVSHLYFQPGIFNVTLTVMDDQGLSSSTSVILVVRPRPQHDVGIDFVYVRPSETLVAGQSAVVTVTVVNRGISDENVTVTAFYNGVPIGSMTVLIHGSQFYPNNAYVQIFWDTSTVSPGEYIIAASAQTPLDEDTSNNMFRDGLATVLPPPTLTLSHDRASFGTKVVLNGDGFPQTPFPQGFPRPILVSFDNQFIGFVFTMEGGFQFTFNIPNAQPGLHTINILDVLAFLRVNTSITVIDASAIELDLEVGDFYFEGDTALATLLVLKNGQRIDPTTLRATLTLPNGSTRTLDVTKVQDTTGLYKIEISIPGRGSVGTYTINLDASYQTEIVGSEGHAIKIFAVKTVWLSPGRVRTLSVAGSLVAVVGLIVATKFGVLNLKGKKTRGKVPTSTGDNAVESTQGETGQQAQPHNSD